MLELRIPVRMTRAFRRLSDGLEAVAKFMDQRRHRITARQRVHQLRQRVLEPEPRLRLLQRRTPGTGSPNCPSLATPSSSSRRPLWIVARASPVAADTSGSPPNPIARDSVAARSRRVRSSRRAAIAEYLATIVSPVAVSRERGALSLTTDERLRRAERIVGLVEKKTG